MGYQDREYYQEDQTPGGFQLGNDLSYTWRLVILFSGIFLANLFLFQDPHLFLFQDPQGDPAKHDLASFLSLRGDTVVQPLYWWRFLTYAFVYDRTALQPLFWNMIGLVCFGSAIESAYGRREYLRYILLAILLGGLLWGIRVFFVHGGTTGDAATRAILHNAGILGAGGMVTAIALLYCIKYPFNTINLMMVLPVPAWLIGLLIIVGNVFQAGQIFQSPGASIVGADVHVAGALFAIGYYYFDWNLTRMFSFRWANTLSRNLGKLLKPQPKLKVYDSDEDDESLYRDLEAEADRILAKIGTEGEASLSKKERETLERYSRLMRQKHR